MTEPLDLDALERGLRLIADGKDPAAAGTALVGLTALTELRTLRAQQAVPLRAQLDAQAGEEEEALDALCGRLADPPDDEPWTGPGGLMAQAAEALRRLARENTRLREIAEGIYPLPPTERDEKDAKIGFLEEQVATLRAEIANFDAIRSQDRRVGVLLVELAGHLGMKCNVNSESILRLAIETVR